MAFNVNCKDCKYCRRGLCDNEYYCIHPKALYFNEGRAVWLFDIDQNVDCDWFEK